VLSKAFRGELLPQDPNDEPTSVLLQRIRALRSTSAESAPRRSPTRAKGSHAAAKVKRPLAALPSAQAAPTLAGDGIPAELVLSALQVSASMAAAEVAAATGLEAPIVKKAIKQLVEAGQVRMEGQKRGARYVAQT
jgi:type I restriction enzyme, S subunit